MSSKQWYIQILRSLYNFLHTAPDLRSIHTHVYVCVRVCACVNASIVVYVCGSEFGLHKITRSPKTTSVTRTEHIVCELCWVIAKPFLP